MFLQKLISDIFQKMSFSYFSSYLLKKFYLRKSLSLFSIIFRYYIAYYVALDNRPKLKFKTVNAIFSKRQNATYQLLPKRALFFEPLKFCWKTPTISRKIYEHLFCIPLLEIA